ncbi:MAG: hypothetical protein GY797_38770 [Deltaproteobacteria bacterium]|nr:hypothetical protein [Deltaproteobacteria bacterium]
MMAILVDFLAIWLVGCMLSWCILKFCTFISKGKQLDATSFKIGIGCSWFVVVWFVAMLIKRALNKPVERKTHRPPFVQGMTDAEMVKYTLNDYWTKAVQFTDFDMNPSLPIKGSPLCMEYYKPKFHPNDRCLGCPIKKAQFGCEETGFWAFYASINEAGEDRRDAAIKIARLFESIYHELLLNRNLG